jgi:hypothetical protein
MKFKTTIILFSVLFILLAFVYFFEIRGKAAREKAKEKEEKLVDLASDNIQKITFKKEDETLTFKKNEKGEWLIAEPMEVKADSSEVSSLADDFSQLKIERVVEAEPKDLKKYEIPKKEIDLWVKGQEQPVKILIGMGNPLDNTFFAKREDSKKVVLLSSSLKSALDKKFFDFRQKDVFLFETDKVKNIELRAKDIEWEVLNKDEDWFLNKPVKALAKKSTVDNILSSLSDLKAKAFVAEEKKPEDLKKYGLEKPEYEVALHLPSANQDVVFYLHKAADKNYATTSLSPKLVEIESQIFTDLEKKPEDLREKQVAVFNPWEADKLSLRKGDLSLTVVKDKDEKWHFDTAAKEAADSSKIETFIRKIEGLEAAEFIDSPANLKDFGLDKPQTEVKIQVKESEGKVKEVDVLVGTENKEKKQVVVKNAKFDYLFRVDSSFLEEFPKAAKDWKVEEKKEEKK